MRVNESGPRCRGLVLVAGANPSGNLGGHTLGPGVYAAPAGSFPIQGGDLTLDAAGDVNAVWVFQRASTLTVGGPAAAFPQSLILTAGAQAKNVFWQVGPRSPWSIPSSTYRPRRVRKYSWSTT